MSASAAVADPLLRRACGQRARLGPSTYCTYALVFTALRAGLATQLSDFATNRQNNPARVLKAQTEVDANCLLPSLATFRF